MQHALIKYIRSVALQAACTGSCELKTVSPGPSPGWTKPFPCREYTACLPDEFSWRCLCNKHGIVPYQMCVLCEFVACKLEPAVCTLLPFGVSWSFMVVGCSGKYLALVYMCGVEHASQNLKSLQLYYHQLHSIVAHPFLCVATWPWHYIYDMLKNFMSGWSCIGLAQPAKSVCPMLEGAR